MNLTQLAEIHTTDKLQHGFIDVYEKHFSVKREVVQSVLEIGVYKGDSLKMWADYFPNAKILGCDIISYSLNAFGNRINTYVVNQESRKSILDFLSFLGDKTKFDIIIDDGCHTMEGQQTSLAILWSTLSSGGIYVVEDLHTSLPHNPYEWAGGKCLPDFSNSSLKSLYMLQNTRQIQSVYMTDAEMQRINSECLNCTVYDVKGDERHITSVLVKR